MPVAPYHMVVQLDNREDPRDTAQLISEVFVPGSRESSIASSPSIARLSKSVVLRLPDSYCSVSKETLAHDEKS